MQNESAHALENFNKVHPVLGMLVSSPLRHQMELPSSDEADTAIYSDVKHLLKTIRTESSIAAWWSWFLLSFGFFYALTRIFHPFFWARMGAAFFDFFARGGIVHGIFGPERRPGRQFPQPPLFISCRGQHCSRRYALLRRWPTWRKRSWWG
jgi:hypothetical protein